MRFVLSAYAFLVGTFCGSLAVAGDERADSKAPIIILKLDDVGAWVSPRWHRVADYLEEKKIKCSMGVIGESLNTIQPDTVKWIQAHHDSGMIEYWLHGYHMRTPKETGPGEFMRGTADEQAAVIEKGEALAKEKLGFTFAAFGPHWTPTNDETEQALQASPEIKIWLNGPKEPKSYKKLSIPRVMGLENPIFHPDIDKFKQAYETIGHNESVLVLQGHPDMWLGAPQWEGFTKIIDYLQSQHCTFMTPTEYATSLQKSDAAK